MLLSVISSPNEAICSPPLAPSCVKQERDAGAEAGAGSLQRVEDSSATAAVLDEGEGGRRVVTS